MEDFDSFDKRFAKFSLKDRSDIRFAYWIAKYGHRGQQRQGSKAERYFEHVRSVALILYDELHIYDTQIIVAALLHDVLEDSGILGNPKTLSHEEWVTETFRRLEINFGLHVAKLVHALTKYDNMDSYIKGMQDNPTAILVKMADRLHNLRSAHGLSKKRQERKIKETEEIYFPLFDKIQDLFPIAHKYLMNEIKSELYVKE